MIILQKLVDPDDENTYDKCDVEFTIHNDDIDLTTLLVDIEKFLRACGYIFNGELDIFGGKDE